MHAAPWASQYKSLTHLSMHHQLGVFSIYDDEFLHIAQLYRHDVWLVIYVCCVCLWNSWLSFLFRFLLLILKKQKKTKMACYFFPSSFPLTCCRLNRCAQVALYCLKPDENNKRLGPRLFVSLWSDTDISHDGRDIVGAFDLIPSFCSFSCAVLKMFSFLLFFLPIC